MAIITLTTDWQNRDYYSGMMKGRLLRLIAGAVITDISQQIEPFHSLQAAFLLRQVIPEFPPETIHLILVNQGHRPDIWPVAVQYDGQYLIGWDDGLISLIMKNPPECILKLIPNVMDQMDRLTGADESSRSLSPGFPELSVFPRVALFLSLGFRLTEAGDHSPDFNRHSLGLPAVQKDEITGQVVYIDSYGNAITNIDRALFDRSAKSRNFEIVIKSNYYRIKRVDETYMDTEPGELLSLFNSAGLLEIAISQGNASGLLGIVPGNALKIKFKNE